MPNEQSILIDVPHVFHSLTLSDSELHVFFGMYLAKHTNVLSNNMMTLHEIFDIDHLADCLLLYFDCATTLEELQLNNEKLKNKFDYYLHYSKEMIGYMMY